MSSLILKDYFALNVSFLLVVPTFFWHFLFSIVMFSFLIVSVKYNGNAWLRTSVRTDGLTPRARRKKKQKKIAHSCSQSRLAPVLSLWTTHGSMCCNTLGVQLALAPAFHKHKHHFFIHDHRPMIMFLI
jgi:hypothetical protein